MQTIQEKIEFLQAMVRWLEDLPNKHFHRSLGICSNLTMGRRSVVELQACFPKWEHFSGNQDYPIEGNSYAYDAQENKWDKESHYGKLRYNLLEHCITYFRNEIENLKGNE